MPSDARSRFVEAMQAIKAHMDARFAAHTPAYIQAACKAYADLECAGSACITCGCRHCAIGHAACRAAIVKAVFGE